MHPLISLTVNFAPYNPAVAYMCVVKFVAVVKLAPSPKSQFYSLIAPLPGVDVELKTTELPTQYVDNGVVKFAVGELKTEMVLVVELSLAVFLLIVSFTVKVPATL